MLKLSIKPLAVSALFAMSLTSAATLAVAQENRGIVLQESAAEAPGYCHIKYMAFTEESDWNDQHTCVPEHAVGGDETVGPTCVSCLASSPRSRPFRWSFMAVRFPCPPKSKVPSAGWSSPPPMARCWKGARSR